jgi:predicted RNA-binding protein with PUA-like domain
LESKQAFQARKITMSKKYWLMKSEPDAFSIQDLQSRPGQREHWDGVRNYQARNHMRDLMSVGDEVLFYHSSCTPAGIVGLASIVAAGYPDPSALNPESKYFDPKATPDKNPWVMVDVKFKREFKTMLTLETMRSIPGLEAMQLLRKGMRLSVQPVTPEEFAIIMKVVGD